MTYYRVLRFLAGTLLRLVCRVEIRHKGSIPDSGGLIVCSNHIHNFDPVLMAMGVRRQLHFMAKVEMFSWPILGWLARKGGAFPVKRGSADIQAVKHSLELLRSGKVLGIFPEGTRSKTGEVNAPFQGVTMLAERTGVLIVPAAIHGEYKMGKRISIVYGEPVDVKSLCPDQPYDRALATDKLMEIIKDLKESLK